MSSITPTAPTAAQLADPGVAKIWKAAQDFEAMTLSALLKPMFDTVDLAHNPLGGGDGEATWAPMLVDEYAKQMTQRGGMGLAVPVFQQMLRMQEDKQGKEGKK
jgi:Rod binding domain-containing protein